MPLDAALRQGAEEGQRVSGAAAQGLGGPGMGSCRFLYHRGDLSGIDKEHSSGLSQGASRRGNLLKSPAAPAGVGREVREPGNRPQSCG